VRVSDGIRTRDRRDHKPAPTISPAALHTFLAPGDHRRPGVTGPLTKRDTESNPLPTAPATTGNWLTQTLRARLLRVRGILSDAAQITLIGPERRAEGPRCRSSASDRLVTGRHQIERFHADPCGFSGGGVAVQKHWPERGKSLFCGRFCRRGTQESNLTLRFWRPLLTAWIAQ
jgi:hypothetical protein